mgnify:CR=1 FL=1
MNKNIKIFGMIIAFSMGWIPALGGAQPGQFIDCSSGNPQCDLMYSSNDLFVPENCPDCVTGQITVEPAVVKTSYQALSYSMPNLPQGQHAVNVTRQVSAPGSSERVLKKGNTQKLGAWLTHDLNEKLAYGDEVHDWEAARGETLKSLLTQWAEVSGWTMVWKLDRDYNLEAGVVFRGTFTEVASAIIRTFARAVPAPIGTFYKGNKVLVISIQEDENAH